MALLDGFVGVGKCWSFLGVIAGYNLPSFITIDRFEKHRLKGVKCLKEQNVFGISLSKRAELQIYQILVTDSTNISYQCLRQAFVRAIDDAINSMEDTETYRILKSQSCCITYESRLRSGKCCRKKANILIAARDIETFGRRFQIRFNGNVREFVDDSTTFILAIGTGQNSPLVLSADALTASLNIDTLEELIVHVATDRVSEKGFPHFWKHEEASKLTSRSNITSYYPVFLASVGNFVLNTTNTDEEPLPQWQVIKFYNDIFKQTHKDTAKPFQKPVLMDLLMKKQSDAKPKMLLELVEGLKRSIKMCKNAKCNVARFEVIVSISKPTNEWCENVLERLEEEFTITDRYLEKVPFSDVEKHIDNTLIPLLNTFKMYCLKIAESDNSTFPACTLQSLQSACAVECLVAFYIYGTASWREGGVMFPASLLKALGLKNKSFFQRKHQGSIFLGLEEFPNLVLYESEEGFELVRYSGPVCMLEGFMDGSKEILKSGLYSDMLRSYRLLEKRKLTVFATKQICKCFYGLILHESYERYLPNHASPTMQLLCRLTHELDLSKTAFQTSHFLDYLFENVNKLLPKLTGKFLQSILHAAPAASLYLSAIKSSMSAYLDEQLKTSTCLMPFAVGTTTVLVLPIWNEQLDGQVLSSMYARYKESFKYIYGFECSNGAMLRTLLLDSPVIDALSIASAHCVK